MSVGLQSAEIADAPKAKRRRARARFPFVFKLFTLTAALILLVVGVAIAITVERARSIAKSSVSDAISRAGNLFVDFEHRRLKELSLGARTLANDSPFHAYIENALKPPAAAGPLTGPTGSGVAPAPTQPPQASGPLVVDILDQLQQRKELLGTDLMLLTDDQGIVVARTDIPDLTRVTKEDFYTEQPLLKDLIDRPPPADASGGIPPVVGAIETGGKLYHVAIVPLILDGRPPIGYLMNAYAIDDRFANQIADATHTGALFISSHVPAGSNGVAARSNSAPSSISLDAMPEVKSLFSTAMVIPPHTLTIDRSEYVMTGEPLASKGKPVGGAIFLRSLDSELAPFREIERTLFLAGGIALLLAFVLSWFIARRLTRPIEDLAALAQTVAEGDYSVRPDVKRQDEVGILAASFASMISSLRDKRELESLYAQMAAREVSPSVSTPVAAKAEEATILVTDLRGFAATSEDGEASAVLDRLREAMRLQEAEVLRQDGTVREIVGHRLISTFTGDRGVIHAIRASRAIGEELALHLAAPLSVGVGIATGEFITGSVSFGNDSGMAMVGNAPLLALLFAWEAPTGYAFVSLESAQTGGSELMATGTREEVKLRWLPTPLPVLSLPLQSVNTGVMRTVGGTQQISTVRLDGSTEPMQPHSELTPGTLFAKRYAIEQILGRGGMGVVYRAIDRQLDETVAIKTLTGDVLIRSPEEVERFKREIRLARKITHRNVLRTYDYGESDGIYFISMEYVRGYTLAELLAESPQLAPRVAVGIARQVCRGLEAAHEQGIIHRDMKPPNVLIDQRGEVKLMDFGIARMAEAPESMTATGLIVGTPHYMSPEQVQGKTLDPRSDVYSMGVMMYEMLTGKRPFDSTSLTAILTAHITEQPRPIQEIRTDVPREIIAIVERCMAKDPKARFRDAGELLQALDRVDVAAAA